MVDSEAPDIVQEVFASVARGIGDFHRTKKQGSFRSWLATITRNRVRDHFRKAHKQQHAEGGTHALQMLHEQADELESTICPDSIESPIVKNALDQVRSEFEATTWSAFWQTTMEGTLAKDVAEDTGLSVASVYQAKSRVLRRLRQRLAELPQ